MMEKMIFRLVALVVCFQILSIKCEDLDNKYVYYVIPSKCVEQLNDMSFSSECLKKSLIKSLGYSIVILGSIAKVPLMLNIMKAGSTSGLSMFGLFIESFGCSLMIGYNVHNNNEFNIYGELVFLLLQNVIILFLFLHYNSCYSHFTLYVAILLSSLYLLLNDILPSQIYSYNIPINILIVLLSKSPQIFINHKNQSTASLSLISSTLFFGGAAARLITIIDAV